MNADQYVTNINDIHKRTNIPQKETGQLSMSDKKILEIALKDLCIALEELRTLHEKIDLENQQLSVHQQKLEKECQYYRDLFNSAPDGYLVTDADGVILEANQTAARLLNVEREFLIAQPLNRFIANQGWQNFRSQLLNLRQKSWRKDFTVQLQSLNKAAFDAILSVTIVRDIEGNVLHLRWMLHDTSLTTQTANLINKIKHQNLQLAEASQIKSNFLSTVSHELRTPLTAILGFCQVLLSNSKNGLINQRIYLLERILNNSKNLLNLINDILDYAKLEAGQLSFELEEFNFVELAQETIEQMRDLLTNKQLNLIVNISLSNPQIVNDKSRLQQVFVNLLSNAIKFTKNGTIYIEIWEQTPEKIAFAVRDTGIGIESQNLPHIFEAFRQVDQTLNRKYNGTGLGLAITQALVQMMNGTITVESEFGKGSTFNVEFPRQILSL